MNFFLTRNFYLFTITFLVFLLTISCGDELIEAKNEITSEDDAKIGKTIDQALLNYIDTFPNISLLDQQTYAAAYTYVHQISQSINGSNIFLALAAAPQGTPYNNNHTLTIRIIDQPGNSGAFILPGGYIYLYKDLLKEINSEAAFVPILAHLMACSKNRYDVEKLEKRFSTNFLLDVALGRDINPSSGAGISTILNTLENEPYSTDLVDILDKEAENTVCELGYDINPYAMWLISHSKNNTNWCHQFPRSQSQDDYTAHLLSAVDSPLSCNGSIIEGGYPQFKDLLN